MGAVLEPHISHTAQRCGAAGPVLVVHDTSEFAYTGEDREGLGRLRGNKSQGFLFHASLAVEAGSRQPLGLLGHKVWVREQERSAVVQGRRGPRKASGPDYARREHKESDRWTEQVEASVAKLPSSKEVIHVMDREADSFALLATLHERHRDFVIRVGRDRKTTHDQDTLVELAARAEGIAQVEVPVSARAPKGAPRSNKTFAQRDARIAKLEFSGTKAEIRAPGYTRGLAATLPVHVVHVRELEAQASHQPIEWMLLTSLPVDTAEQVQRVVEIYRTRWLIEEFFKALKSGCDMERRELESLDTLTNMLAICIPIAYQLLALRHLARTRPSAPARALFSDAQLAILRAKAKLAPEATAHQALVAVAYLGSHFEPFERKLPGWKVLARGLERLLTYEEGWLIRDEDPIKR
jgi:hypothetical protein